MTYDLAIIGGGPAGVAAGVYASRKRLKTVFIAREFGGQSTVSDGIENWIGTIKISGADLAKNLEAHLRAYADDILDIKAGETVTSVVKIPLSKGGETHADVAGVVSPLEKGVPHSDVTYQAKTVLVTAGSARRKLEVKGADALEHKGLTYCASCDGPLFADMDVAVVGGGNAGFESAAQLLAYAKSVTLLNRGDDFKADPVTVKKVLAHPKMKAILGAEILEVKGDTFVTGLVYQTKESGGSKELPVQGIFVEIGSSPATDLLDGLVELTPYKQVIVDPKTQQTSQKGIWAAGDCTDGLYHQNNIAAGDAVKALEDIYLYLHAS
ncbi:MAG: Alkyl hydroperoxide reductase [Parcubacteria group bacterium GW2011_GWA2_49_9]|nr:MAG: Alkyl hydroperoxide reductase [Parcubacteria group bacterium GW2011_GWA2_49_9]